MKTHQQHFGIKKQLGFTLIELLITVVIAGILLAVGVPSFNTFLKKSRLTTNINTFVTDAALTKSEALKRGGRVTMCKATFADTDMDGIPDAYVCQLGLGSDWSQGWVIFTDINNDAVYNTAIEALIKQTGAFGTEFTMIGNVNVRNYISYVSSGLTQQIGGGLQAGTITLCDDRGANFAKAAIVSSTGRLRQATDGGDADTIVEGGGGANVTC